MLCQFRKPVYIYRTCHNIYIYRRMHTLASGVNSTFPPCTRKGGGPKRLTCACCRGRRPRSEHTSIRIMHPQGRRPQAANMCMHPREATPQRTYIYMRICRICTRGRRPHSEHICTQGRRPPGEHSARAHARALRLGSGEFFHLRTTIHKINPYIYCPYLI